MISAGLALEATCRILGAWAVLAGATWLADAPRWAAGGPLGHDLNRLRRAQWSRWRIWGQLHSARGLALLGAAQAVLGAWLIAVPDQPLFALLALGLVAAAQGARGAPDGADKIALVVIAGGSLMAAGGALGQPVLVLAGTLWIGGQLTLAYATAGLSKLRLPPWRDGTAVRAALSSVMFGSDTTARILRSDSAARLLGWAVILPEVLFPLALLLPGAWLAAVLGLFLLFHLAIAAAMGLNTYPLAFAAAYPATLVLGQGLRTTLGIA